MNILKFAAAFAAILLGATAASAATITCDTKGSPGESIFTVNDAVNATCMYGPQDFASDVNGIGAFGFADWLLADRNETSKPGGATGHITFASGHVNGGISGSFAINTPIPSDVVSVMVSLKTSNTSGLFLMDLADLASDWSIFKPGSTTEGKALSHSTLFYRVGTLPSVPLPASGILLLAGLGGLTMVRRRRS